MKNTALFTTKSLSSLPEIGEVLDFAHCFELEAETGALLLKRGADAVIPSGCGPAKFYYEEEYFACSGASTSCTGKNCSGCEAADWDKEAGAGHLKNAYGGSRISDTVQYSDGLQHHDWIDVDGAERDSYVFIKTIEENYYLSTDDFGNGRTLENIVRWILEGGNGVTLNLA